MSKTLGHILHIDAERLRVDFDQLAQFGATGDGGVHRPTFSEAHLAARAWLRERIGTAGLELRVDGAGNHSAYLGCGPARAPVVLLGSHLDSVPNGGRFDGALGVLAALEVLRVVKQAHHALALNLELIDFTDEEGTLVGFLGSAAIAGHMDPATLAAPRGGRTELEAGMRRAGISDESILTALRRPESFAGYLELHIEQGRKLERAHGDIGIVTGIVGLGSYRLVFVGRADHSGTTSMADRCDAGQGACAFALSARQLVMTEFPDCVVNIGDMRFQPGAFNIVPARVAVALEYRAPTEAEFQRLETALVALARREADRAGLALEAEPLNYTPPAPMSARFQEIVAGVCDELGLAHMALTSGAGHDGQLLAGLCPVGMIFVPSAGGASHSPREFTAWHDCVNGAAVLLETVLRVAREGVEA